MSADFASVNAGLVAATQHESAHDRLVKAAGEVRAFMDVLGATRMGVLPHPLFIDRRDYDNLVAAAIALVDAQTWILRSLLELHPPREMVARLGLPPVLAQLMDPDQLLTSERVVARFDVLPTPQGYKFCEFNVDTSVSGFEFFDCARVQCEQAGLDWLSSTTSPSEQIARLVAREFDRGAYDRVVVCDWSSRIGIGYFGFELLRDAITAALPGIPVHLVYHRDYPDRWLEPDAGRRTLVYRGFMFEDIDEMSFVRRLFASGAHIMNRFETELRAHKSWLAILHDAAASGDLPPVARQAVEAYLPRTVRPTADNLDDILAHRADWVFKYGFSSGGHAVLMGSEHSARSLRHHLDERGFDGWVAQQRLDTTGVFCAPDVDRAPRRLEVVLGLYIIGDTAHGMNVRADAANSVVNIHQSASSGWAIPMTAASRHRAVAGLSGIAG